jgi:hypothetical protein
LLEQLVHQRGFAVVHVGDNGDITNETRIHETLFADPDLPEEKGFLMIQGIKGRMKAVYNAG